MEKFITKKRAWILVAVAILGALAGMLAMRAVGNLLLGGTLFGGEWPWQ